ncbi:MAG: GNAT family N-acetyltransferase [Bacilli bacterium]|nr:GNAT family N-acetyltransferase [Bacilli bacterium]MDD4077183.1 N-acetyltransferase [Bacilli bacterium]
MIRKANLSDIDTILTVIADAKELFRKNNSLQWQDTDGYPHRRTVHADILKEWLYLNFRSNRLAGIITLAQEPDESYRVIHEGNWLNNRKYYTIHRLAVKKEFYRQGVAQELVDYAFEITRRSGVFDIRCDTAAENIAMNRLLEKCGFVRCGIIYLVRGSCLEPKRIAYHKSFDNKLIKSNNIKKMV